MRARTYAPRVLGLAAVSLLGGLVALGAAALLGELGGGTTTVVQTSPSPAAAAPAVAESRLSVSDVYRRAASGVVQITSRSTPGDDDFTRRFAPPEAQQTLGSGFVLDKAGHIITNYHVIEGGDSIEVSFSNQDTLEAKLVGSDPSTDLAILRVEASSRGLAPLQLGDSDLVRVGDPVVAIGNPFGLDRTATAGIVSAVQERTITAPNGYPIDHVIQTDAPINRGNSGGPLLNDRGEVIGVNSQISTGNDGTETSNGIGFAVPSNTVKNIAAQLIDRGKVYRAYLGVAGTTLDPELARLFGLPVDTGVLVERVAPDAPGGRAGLVAGTNDVVVAGESYTLGGDVIVAIGGMRVASLPELRDVLARHRPGNVVGIEIYRGSKLLTVRVVLGEQPTTS